MSFIALAVQTARFIDYLAIQETLWAGGDRARGVEMGVLLLLKGRKEGSHVDVQRSIVGTKLR